MSFFAGKVVLVTGGSAGLGWHTARAFARGGAQVVITARGAKRLEAAAAELRRAGGTVTSIAADVTSQHEVDDLFRHLDHEYQRLDVLVNCAGRSARGLASQVAPAQFLELMELNFLGLVRASQAALPRLVASRGHLINIGSLASKVATPYLGAYPASKFAVAAYSQQLRLELAPQGVHVLLVCPGPIERRDADGRYENEARHLPEAAGRPGGGAKVKATDPEKLAGRIVRACQKRQAELVLPSQARWLAAISQLWPSLGDWIINRVSPP